MDALIGRFGDLLIGLQIIKSPNHQLAKS